GGGESVSFLLSVASQHTLEQSSTTCATTTTLSQCSVCQHRQQHNQSRHQVGGAVQRVGATDHREKVAGGGILRPAHRVVRKDVHLVLAPGSCSSITYVL